MTSDEEKADILKKLLVGSKLQASPQYETNARLEAVGGAVTRIPLKPVVALAMAGLLDKRQHYPFTHYTLTTEGRLAAIALMVEEDPSYVPAAEPDKEEPNMIPEAEEILILEVPPSEEVPAVTQEAPSLEQPVAEAAPAKVRKPKPALLVLASRDGAPWYTETAYTALLLAQDSSWQSAYLAKRPVGKLLWSAAEYFPESKRQLKVRVSRQDGEVTSYNHLQESDALFLVAK